MGRSIFTKRCLYILLALSAKGLVGCYEKPPTAVKGNLADSLSSCAENLPKRYAGRADTTATVAGQRAQLKGMVLIPGGTFTMGAADNAGRADEYPLRSVYVDAFWMDATEVTNAEFARFVKATGYITTAERKPDWELLKKQLPAGTPKPADSLLVAASLVFEAPQRTDGLQDVSQWWSWKKNAHWRQPQGPGSTIKGKDNHPVVHISWDDAAAYSAWAGKRLPTEAEWEYASRAGQEKQPFPWGKEAVDQGLQKANIWQGVFPIKNSKQDGYYRTAPVKGFKPNAFGLYDMAGNVWEWCNDWYRSDYYQTSGGKVRNPQGPPDSYDPAEPGMPKKVVRGGSFLCNASYCAGYRVSARMKTAPDTGLEHTGFRCVVSK